MAEYKANSHRSKEEKKQEVVDKKKVEKIVNGTVKTKKKSEVNKLTDVFLAEDVTSVKHYILEEVIIPAAKKALSDIVTSGIDMLLYGETKSRDKKSKGHSHTSYTKYYDRDEERGRSVNTRPRRAGYDYDDIILETRGEAEDVLDRMDDLLDTYGVVSVGDLYDLVGKETRYTDNKYGWSNLRNADIHRMRDGYLLKLPKALPLD